MKNFTTQIQTLFMETSQSDDLIKTRPELKSQVFLKKPSEVDSAIPTPYGSGDKPLKLVQIFFLCISSDFNSSFQPKNQFIEDQNPEKSLMKIVTFTSTRLKLFKINSQEKIPMVQRKKSFLQN